VSSTDTISAAQFSRERGVTRQTEWRWRQLGIAPDHEVIRVKGRPYIRYSRQAIAEWLRNR
jgi:hypothetical protein